MTDTLPKLQLKVRDYLDELAEELTQDTKLPFNYAREAVKLTALASLRATRANFPYLACAAERNRKVA